MEGYVKSWWAEYSSPGSYRSNCIASTIRSWVGSHWSPSSSASGWSWSLIKFSSTFNKSAIRRKILSTIASCSRCIHPPVDDRASALDPRRTFLFNSLLSPFTLLAKTVDRSIITSPLTPDARSMRCCVSTGERNFFTSRTRGAQLRTLRVSDIVVTLLLLPFLKLLDWNCLISNIRCFSMFGR